MFLRSLTLKGFKSFADKTTLEFAPGISVIVGPNGSGKSNIVDAISWVLGEQGARALHTVVSQGQLEEVLTARPEERRQYIEEAAGIAKHRRRKDRAQRKLGSLEQDLLRLQDVLNELRRQLKPLRAQADVAQKHEKLSNEADTLAWRLATARLRQLMEARESKRAGWEAGLAVREGGKKRLEELDTKIESLTSAREQATTALTHAEAAVAEAQTTKTVAE